jgi:hypothetical protein
VGEVYSSLAGVDRLRYDFAHSTRENHRRAAVSAAIGNGVRPCHCRCRRLRCSRHVFVCRKCLTCGFSLGSPPSSCGGEQHASHSTRPSLAQCEATSVNWPPSSVLDPFCFFLVKFVSEQKTEQIGSWPRFVAFTVSLYFLDHPTDPRKQSSAKPRVQHYPQWCASTHFLSATQFAKRRGNALTYMYEFESKRIK